MRARLWIALLVTAACGEVPALPGGRVALDDTTVDETAFAVRTLSDKILFSGADSGGSPGPGTFGVIGRIWM